MYASTRIARSALPTVLWEGGPLQIGQLTCADCSSAVLGSRRYHQQHVLPAIHSRKCEQQGGKQHACIPYPECERNLP